MSDKLESLGNILKWVVYFIAAVGIAIYAISGGDFTVIDKWVTALINKLPG